MPFPSFPRAVPAMAIAIGLAPGVAGASPAVNFTGPLVTPAVNTLPAGVLNIEPYLIHAHTRGVYDNAGGRHASRPTLRQWQLALPMTYGVTDSLGVQLTPTASRTSGGGMHTDGLLRVGDTNLRLQQRLMAPDADGTGLVVAVAAAHNLTTGKYHQLDTNPLNATGSGAARTHWIVGAQRLYLLDGGRAMRWRGQVAWSPSPRAIRVRGASIYGTGEGFRGRAHASQAWNATLAAEYALDPCWVLVGEAVWSRQGSLRITSDHGTVARLKPGQTFSLAPAVEYHFSSTMGLIAGVQFTVAGRNRSDDVTPQVALNMLF